jgi:hypothetical protein
MERKSVSHIQKNVTASLRSNRYLRYERQTPTYPHHPNHTLFFKGPLNCSNTRNTL